MGAPTNNKLRCETCKSRMVFIGDRNLDLNNAPYSGRFDRSEARSSRVVNNVYACPSCGEVRLFLVPEDLELLKHFGEHDDLRQRVIHQHGSVRAHPKFKQYLASDPANEFLDKRDQELAFLTWLTANR